MSTTSQKGNLYKNGTILTSELQMLHDKEAKGCVCWEWVQTDFSYIIGLGIHSLQMKTASE
jgi:hypothetical protein